MADISDANADLIQAKEEGIAKLGISEIQIGDKRQKFLDPLKLREYRRAVEDDADTDGPFISMRLERP